MAVRNVTLDVIAKKHSEELDKLAAQFDKTATEIDKADASARRHTSTMEILDREITNAKTRVKELGEEYDRTGKVEVFRNLRSAKRDLSDFERLSRELGSTLEKGGEKGESAFVQLRRVVSQTMDNVEMATKHAHGVIASFSAGLKALPAPVKIPIVLALGTVALTGVSALGGAVTGALGLGGIATGIALQLGDPKVRDALSGLGGRIKRTFTESASAFGSETAHGLAVLNAELDRLGPKFSSIFGKLAPYVGPLVQGIAKGIDGLASGIDRAADRVGPVMAVLSKDFAGIGRTVGDFFDEISKGSQGGAMALHSLIVAAEQVAMGLARLIHGAEDFYLGMAKLGTASGDAMAKTFGWVPIVGDRLQRNAKQAHDFANALQASKGSSDNLTGSTFGLVGALDQEAIKTNTATSSIQRWTQAIDDAFKKNMSFDTANLNAQLAVAQFTEAVKGNSTAMSGNSAQALALRSQLLSTIEQLKQAKDAQIQQTGNSREATDAYNAQVDALLKIAEKAGLSKDALDELRGSYYVNVVTTYTSRGTPPVSGEYSDITTGRIGGRASGGPVSAGVPYVVGEDGPEIFMPKTAGTIIPNARSARGGTPMAMPAPVVHVYLGDEEILDRVRVVVQRHDAVTAAAVAGGVRY